MAFAATPLAPTLPDVAPYVAEIQRLTEAMVAMASSPGYGAHYGMLVPLPPQLTRTWHPPPDHANTIAGSMGGTTPTMETNAM